MNQKYQKFQKGDKCKIVFGEGDETICIFDHYINLYEAFVINVNDLAYFYRKYCEQQYPDGFWEYTRSKRNACYIDCIRLIPV